MSEFATLCYYKNQNISITEQKNYFVNEYEDKDTDHTLPFLQLLQSSNINFQNQDLSGTKKDFIDILELINNGIVSDIDSEILIQYSKDLIQIIDNLQNDTSQQQTIFYALKIILSFFLMTNNVVMDNIIQNGFLPFFQNLLNFPEIHVRETAIFIVALLFSSSLCFPVVMNSSLFTDLSDIYMSYLKIQDFKKSFHILMVVSNAFNNVTKYYDVYDNITLEIIEKIIELYSLSFQINLETDIISRFIDLIEIIKRKTINISSILFKFDIPSQFYNILMHGQSFKNHSLFFFAYLTSNMDEKNFVKIKSFYDFDLFINLLIKSDDFSSFNPNYAFLILANSLKYDHDLQLLNLISSDTFISFIWEFLQNSDFNLKYYASQCLFSALCAASFKSIQIVKKLFKSEIMIDALDIIDCDISDFIIQILHTLDCTITNLSNIQNTKEIPYYVAFKEKIYQLVEELQDSNYDDVKLLAYKIQQKHFLKVL